jgi:outer membrane protein W
MRKKTAVLLFLSILGLGAHGAQAAERWTLRLSPAWLDTDSKLVENNPDTGESREVSAGGAGGLAASLDRSLGERWDLEAGLVATRLPTTLELRTLGGARLAANDRLQVVSPFLMLVWHPRREARFSPFLGLGMAYTQFGNLSLAGATVESGDDFGWLAQAGAELKLRRLRLFSSLLFLDTAYQGQVPGEPGIDLDVELRGLSVGLAIPLE